MSCMVTYRMSYTVTYRMSDSMTYRMSLSSSYRPPLQMHTDGDTGKILLKKKLRQRQMLLSFTGAFLYHFIAVFLIQCVGDEELRNDSANVNLSFGTGKRYGRKIRRQTLFSAARTIP